jgi:transmembrane protein EpsG
MLFTVLIYCFVLFLSTGLSFFQRNLKSLNNHKNSYKLISLVPIILISSLRGNFVGTDAHNYFEFYSDIIVSDFTSFLNYLFIDILNVEPLYYFLQWILKYLNADYRVFLIFIYSLIWGSIYYASKNHIKYFYHVLFFSITLGYMFFSFNGVRQSIGLAIVFVGVNYLIDSNNKLFFLIIFIASLFHYSAILLIPIIWLISKINIEKKYWIIIIAIAFFLPMNFFYFPIQYLFSYLPRYSNYINDIIQYDYGVTVITFGVFLNYIVMLLPLLYFNISKINPYNNLIFKISLTGAVLYILFSGNMIFNRFIVYFTFFQIFQYSLIFDHLNKTNKRYDKLILTSFFVICLLIKIGVNDSGVSPYNFA